MPDAVTVGSRPFVDHSFAGAPDASTGRRLKLIGGGGQQQGGAAQSHTKQAIQYGTDRLTWAQATRESTQ